MRKTVEERFWAKVSKKGRDDCWKWAGSKMTAGYGEISIGLKLVGSHRVSWELHNGPIPDGLWVLHACDNRSCVNPEHLFLGTQQDNTDDMMQKGRHGRAKLSKEEVLKIRAQCKGGVSRNVLAERYGVSRWTIKDIALGYSWTHV